MFLGKRLKRIIVNALRLAIHTVGNDLVVRARDIDRAAVRQMSAVRQIHPENRVARLQECKEHRHVRLCARVRLHIRPICSKQLLRTVNGKLFHDINVLTAAVVPLAGIALRILVREDTALCLHNGTAYDVLRGDEFQLRTLAVQLLPDCRIHLRIGFSQCIHNAHRTLLTLLSDSAVP